MDEFTNKCSFCGAPAEECDMLIASAASGVVLVAICNSCVEGCVDLMIEVGSSADPVIDDKKLIKYH